MNRRSKTYTPEGFPAAWKRFVADLKARDLNKLQHSFVNLGPELFGSIGLPRLAGKVLLLFLSACFFMWLGSVIFG